MEKDFIWWMNKQANCPIAELCMFTIKGHPKKSVGVHQVIISLIEEHSKKPDIARKRIVEPVGDLTQIKLFARQKAGGWDVRENEVDCDIQLPVLVCFLPHSWI